MYACSTANACVRACRLKVIDGRISKVTSKIAPQGKTVIDGRGKTLLPGLIDAHTHTWGDALTQAVGFGVTTELDMFTDHRFAASARARNGSTEGEVQADLFSAGTLITAPGGHGTEYGIDIPVIENAAEASAFVQARLDEGSDYIKIVYNAVEARRQDFPSISRETLAAVIDASHQQDRLAVVHISNLVSAEHAVAAGADGLVHTFMDAPASTALLDAMSEQNSFCHTDPGGDGVHGRWQSGSGPAGRRTPDSPTGWFRPGSTQQPFSRFRDSPEHTRHGTGEYTAHA